MTDTAANGPQGPNDDARPQEAKKPMLYAHFTARYLPPLKAFQDFNRETDSRFAAKGCITIEPCSAGGVLIAATTGHAMALIHDAGGYASRAMHIMVPHDAFRAATAPEPIHMTWEGWDYDLDLPKWAQPDSVHVFEAGMFVTPKMRHPQWAEASAGFRPALYSCTASSGPHIYPGLDFRIAEGRAADWSRLAETIRENKTVTEPDWHFNPWAAHLLDPILQTFIEVSPDRSVCHRTIRSATHDAPEVSQ